MVSSASVPTQYTLTWDARTSSDAPTESPRRSDLCQSSQRRLREACDGCRHSRVRCGGGQPCSRCHTRGMDCHYGVSRRSGRLRASPLRDTQPAATITTSSPTISSVTANALDETNGHPKSTPMVDPSAVLVSSSQPDLGNFNTDAWLNFSTFMGAPSSSSLDDLNLYPSFAVDMPPTQLYDAPTTTTINDNSNHNNTFSPPHTPPIRNAPSTCNCLSSQFSCMATMTSFRDANNVGIDTILNTARETTKMLSDQLNCTDCTKGTWSFVVNILILQRLLYMFCSLATCRYIDVKSVKLGVGNYQLSEEEDLTHKKMLALSSLKLLEEFLGNFRDAVNKFLNLTATMKSQCNTPLTTDYANLKFAADGLDYITARLKTIKGTIESDSWRRV
ncbi:hypothetical protein BGW36DRAFT_427851 [Talaromyces proteolyticus]|uniref:Zn(2)-C6 fungal-type domain-containing protein n=1 Tax=Talaromyces proteolyticus TaxID=1131652 RepID=A0AAD4KQA0_9EURO|nr:uncharacterized protein BGW36DRAFT_427851 [Talaromyces proteolyticus]KAH8697912.1 hypothetical protein BGW36DRAFT_427851 [Talaromyces proteolyticus]